MIYEIGVLLAILITGIAGIWFAYKYYKKRQMVSMKEKDIPESLLTIFDEAEKEMKGGIKEDGTRKSPSEILWKIARRIGKEEVARVSSEPIGTEQTITDGELHEEPKRQDDIQIRAATSINKDKSIIRKSGPNNIGRIISRIRGRK